MSSPLFDRFVFPCQHAYHVLTVRILIHAVSQISYGPLSHSFRVYNFTCRILRPQESSVVPRPGCIANCSRESSENVEQLSYQPNAESFTI